MADCMIFPDTVEEFMEQYKVVDTEQVYSNGTEFVPIFRMKQWFDHAPTIEPERKTGKWIVHMQRGNWSDREQKTCSECGKTFKNLDVANYCPNCGLPMEGEEE